MTGQYFVDSSRVVVITGVPRLPSEAHGAIVGGIYDSLTKQVCCETDFHSRDRCTTNVYSLRADNATRTELAHIVFDIELEIIVLLPGRALGGIVDVVVAQVCLLKLLW